MDGSVERFGIWFVLNNHFVQSVEHVVGKEENRKTTEKLCGFNDGGSAEGWSGRGGCWEMEADYLLRTPLQKAADGFKESLLAKFKHLKVIKLNL